MTTERSTSDAAATAVKAAVSLLEARRWRLSIAESLTGGLLAARVVETPGSGDVFAGGLVAYHTEVKRGLLGVPEGPVVSESCAHAMAVGVARLFCVEAALAVTGVAGPERQEGRPVGLVYGACAIAGRVTTRRWQFPSGDPHSVRTATVNAALHLMHDELAALARSAAVTR